MMKDPEIYNILGTEASLNRPVGVKINTTPRADYSYPVGPACRASSTTIPLN
jgi:hypothetical protein